MKQSSITIKDIAKALQLSHSTVARALKGSYKISEETTRRVKEYAERHGYRPNLIAQSLRNQNSRTIGVLLCSIPNSFFAEVINGIESVAAEKDYYVIISQNHESYESEVKNLKHLESRLIDGLLVSLSAETKNVNHFKEFHEKGMPIVFFDRITEEIDTFKVVSDNTSGAYAITSELLKNGYRKIAHITSSQNISITTERLAGYRKALEENNIDYNGNYVKYCLHGGRETKEIEEAIGELFNLPQVPDAIFTGSDRLTIATLSILKKRGLQIPNDLGLGGFSNFTAPELFSPPLTTIVQPAFEMGKTAASLLIQLIEKKRPPNQFEKVILPTTLIVRDSTSKIAEHSLH